MSDKRHFTVVEGKKEHGLFVGRSPSSVAKKVVSKLSKGDKVSFFLREITQGSKKKTYGPYEGQKKKLKKPIKVGDRVYKYESEVHKVEKKGGANIGDIVIKKVYTHVNKNGTTVKNDFGNDKIYILIGPKDGKYIRIQKVAKNEDEVSVLPEKDASLIIDKYKDMYEQGIVNVKAGPYKLTESDVILLNKSSVGGAIRIKINPKHHALTDHGYSHPQKMSLTARHKALFGALSFLQKKYGVKKGFVKLIDQMNAAAVLLKRTDPLESKTIKVDRDWVSGLYKEYKQTGGIGWGSTYTQTFNLLKQNLSGIVVGYTINITKESGAHTTSNENTSDYYFTITDNLGKGDFGSVRKENKLKIKDFKGILNFIIEDPKLLQQFIDKLRADNTEKWKYLIPYLEKLLVKIKEYDSTLAYFKSSDPEYYKIWEDKISEMKNKFRGNFFDKPIYELYADWRAINPRAPKLQIHNIYANPSGIINKNIALPPRINRVLVPTIFANPSNKPNINNINDISLPKRISNKIIGQIYKTDIDLTIDMGDGFSLTIYYGNPNRYQISTYNKSLAASNNIPEVTNKIKSIFPEIPKGKLINLLNHVLLNRENLINYINYDKLVEFINTLIQKYSTSY